MNNDPLGILSNNDPLGILNQRKRSIGAGGSFERESGFYREPEGNLMYRPSETASKYFGGQLQATGGAIRAGKGFVSLPFDLLGALGSDKAQKFAEIIRKNIPEIPAETTADEMAQTLIQYGLPSVGGIKLAQRVLSGVRPSIKFAGELIASGLADIGAASPKEKTLADWINMGPTKSREGETPIEKRIKIGTEGATVGAIAYPAIRLVAGAIKGIGKLAKTIVQPTKTAEDVITKAFREGAINPEKAIAELNETIKKFEGTGFQVTAGTGSADTGILSLEKGLTTEGKTSAMMANIKKSNLQVISDEIASITRKHGGDPEKAKLFFDSYVKGLRLGKENALQVAQKNIEAIEYETQELIDHFAKVEGKQAEASYILNDVIGRELDSLTGKKNALFGMIDPKNEVEITKDRIRTVLNHIFKQRSSFDSTPKKLFALFDKTTKKGFAKILDEKSITPLTFGELQDLRPTLSEAISQARAADQGDVVARLKELKGAVEKETDYLAKQSNPAGIAAKEALGFYKNEFVPRFKEGVGNLYRSSIRKGKPVSPTDVGKKFLTPTSGVDESAKQLKLILSSSKDKDIAEKAIRTHIVSDFADYMTGATPQNVQNKILSYFKNRKIRETLKNFPAIEKEIKAYGRAVLSKKELLTDLGKDIKRVQESMKKTDLMIKQDALRFFVDSDPIKAIDNILTSQDPIKNMKRLVSLARQDPTGEAFNGIRVALGNYIDETVRLAKPTMGKDAYENSLAKMTKLLEIPRIRKTLSLIYSPNEMKVLDRARDMMNTMSRIDFRTTALSPTAELKELSQKGRIMIAATWGIVKGRGIFMISKWIQKALGMDPIPKAQFLLTRAITDPELAKIMLQPVTKANRDHLFKKISAYLLNNYTGKEGQGE